MATDSILSAVRTQLQEEENKAADKLLSVFSTLKDKLVFVEQITLDNHTTKTTYKADFDFDGLTDSDFVAGKTKVHGYEIEYYLAKTPTWIFRLQTIARQ